MADTTWIERLIADDQIDWAIAQLESNLDKFDTETAQEFILISGQWSALQKALRKGIVSHENSSIKHARIRENLLSFIRDLPPSVELEKPKESNRLKSNRIRKAIALTIWILSLSLVVIAYYVPKKGILTEMQIRAERISMKLVNGQDLFHGFELSEAYLQYFKELRVETDSLTRFADGTIDRSETMQTGGVLRLLPSFPGSDISLENIRLQQLCFDDKAQITLQIFGESPYQLDIDLQGEKDITGHFSFLDSLLFSGSYLQLQTRQGTSSLDWVSGKVMVGEAEGGTVSFKGKASGFTLILFPTSNQLIREENVFIDSISFFIQSGGRAISSIQEAHIQFLTKSSSPYFSTDLLPNEYLEIKLGKELRISEILVEPSGIAFTLTGKIELMKRGTDSDKLLVQNPSWLAWLWYNNKFELLLLIILLVGMGWLYRS